MAPPDPSTAELVLRGRRVVLPQGERAASIVVAGGRVRAIEPHGAEPPVGAAVVDAGERVVLPGLVDTHVHVNEPGRTGWEGFETATRAAAAGGVTTIVDMPLNSVPATVTPAALAAKRAAAGGRCRVDVGLWGGVVPGNGDRLAPLAAAGALGFKAFLVDSGVEEFPPVGEEELRVAMPILRELGLPLLVHAEDPGEISPPRAGSHEAWLRSRPPGAEVAAVERLVELCRESGAAVHVVHLSASEALPALRAAREEGLPVTAETCPHYLALAAGEIPAGATEYKCAPPIREAENRDLLWEALSEGAIDLVASDHSPCPPERKAGDFRSAWGGIASLELSLAATWTAGADRGATPADLVRWMAEGPSRLAGIGDRKGSIAPGADADLVVWNPDARFRVDRDRLHQRHPVTPYAGRELRGAVERTWVRGRLVYDRGRSDPFLGPPIGRIVTR